MKLVFEFSGFFAPYKDTLYVQLCTKLQEDIAAGNILIDTIKNGFEVIALNKEAEKKLQYNLKDKLKSVPLKLIGFHMKLVK